MQTSLAPRPTEFELQDDQCICVDWNEDEDTFSVSVFGGPTLFTVPTVETLRHVLAHLDGEVNESIDYREASRRDAADSQQAIDSELRHFGGRE